MIDIEYKRLESNDVEQIIIEYPKDNLQKFLENEDNYLFAGIQGNDAIAYLYGYGMLRPDGRKMFYIHSVDVLPEYQSKGIGTDLIKYSLKYIKDEKQYYKYFVLAEPDNVKACKLYEKYAECEKQVMFSNKEECYD